MNTTSDQRKTNISSDVWLTVGRTSCRRSLIKQLISGDFARPEISGKVRIQHYNWQLHSTGAQR